MEQLNKFSDNNKWPNLGISVDKIKEHLKIKGYILIKNAFGEQDLNSSFLSLCTKIGQPISHDVFGNIIWDIKYRQENVSHLATFSEHNREAELHTDSQYSLVPEDYFGLLCRVKANCGGGGTRLLSLKDIISELNTTSIGRRVKKILMAREFRFLVPSVFNNPFDPREFVSAPILDSNGIRFRMDTIEKSFKLYADFYSVEMVEAYVYLKSLILQSKNIIMLTLEQGDLLFINNRTMLHGREPFNDLNRHLYRIRMIDS